MTIQGSNVGVGTANPGATLDVNGTLAFTNLLNQSLSGNGYAKFGGLIFQWGSTSSIPTGGAQAVTFPTPFASSVYNVQVTLQYAASTNSFGISVGGISTTGFTAYSLSLIHI